MPHMPRLDLLPFFRGHSLSLGQFGVSPDGLGNQNHVKKVKLKFGGMIRTIHANPTSNGASRSRSTANSSRLTNPCRSHENQQSNSTNNHFPFDKRSGLQGLPWKDFSEGYFGLEKEETLMGRISRKDTSKKGDKSESVCTSKQVPRRRVLDGDYEDEEELGSVDVLMDSKREMILTRRQRALQSSKDASASSASLIEFPNGLPPAPPRKQKEKLSEMEQQPKTAEAAQKHRMQVEKAVRESELSEKYLVKTPAGRREKRR